MRALWHHLQELGDGPLPAAYRIVGLSVIGWAAIRGFLLLLNYAVEFEGRRSRWLTEVGLGLVLINTCVFIGFESVVRGEHLTAVFEPRKMDPSQEARLLAEAISAEVSGLGFWVLSTLAGGTVYAWGRFAHRKYLANPQGLWLSLSLLGVVAAASLRHVDALIYRGFHPSGPVDAHYRDRLLLEVLENAIAPMDTAILLVPALCVLACITTIRASVARKRSPGVNLTAAAAVFASGVAAFATTRAHHLDARETLQPRLSPPYRCDHLSVEGMPVHEVPADATFVEAPAVIVDGAGGVLIDGIRTDDGKLRPIMENKRQLWTQLKPDSEFPGNVVFSIPGDLAMEDIRPWLDRVRAAGFPNLHALVGAPQEVFESQSLGAIRRTPACTTIAVGADYTSGESWGEHVRAARR